MTRKYVIRQVSAPGPKRAALLRELHIATLGRDCPMPDFSVGWWWIAYAEDGSPAGFTGVTQSSLAEEYGYLKRSGVVAAHRGHGLQKRFIRVRERRARKNGWRYLISDTTDNVPSSNNLIRTGYVLTDSYQPWAWKNSLYWIKKVS